MKYREATCNDAQAVAAVHAESWRRNYRGAYRDEYLDGDIVSERQRVWQKRLAKPESNQFVILAELDSALVGFACTYGGHDETWGSLLDNIHVHPEMQSAGIGSRLMSETFSWCRAGYSNAGLYLWVLDQNQRAQQFYKRLGAVDRGGELSEPPGGGEIHGRRYVWEELPI